MHGQVGHPFTAGNRAPGLVAPDALEKGLEQLPPRRHAGAGDAQFRPDWSARSPGRQGGHRLRRRRSQTGVRRSDSLEMEIGEGLFQARQGVNTEKAEPPQGPHSSRRSPLILNLEFAAQHPQTACHLRITGLGRRFVITIGNTAVTLQLAARRGFPQAAAWRTIRPPRPQGFAEFDDTAMDELHPPIGAAARHPGSPYRRRKAQ